MYDSIYRISGEFLFHICSVKSRKRLVLSRNSCLLRSKYFYVQKHFDLAVHIATYPACCPLGASVSCTRWFHCGATALSISRRRRRRRCCSFCSLSGRCRRLRVHLCCRLSVDWQRQQTSQRRTLTACIASFHPQFTHIIHITRSLNTLSRQVYQRIGLLLSGRELFGKF